MKWFKICQKYVWYPNKIIMIKIDKKGCYIPINRKESKCGYMGESHRQIFEGAFGTIPNGIVIRHLCNNRRCLNPDHLAAGTHADNVMDRVRSHRSARGEKNGRSKLTKFQVEQIRCDKVTSQRQLARDFGVSPRLIGMIKRRKLWAQTSQHSGIPMNLYRPKHEENREVICAVH